MYLKYFKPVFFTVLGVAAVYFYFSFGPVNVGAPASGSDDLMNLSRILNQQHELTTYENGKISVTEFAVMGYRDIPDDVSIYTLRYNVEGETISVVPVIIRKMVMMLSGKNLKIQLMLNSLKITWNNSRDFDKW